jgi:AraC family cel operon transcriptional repressor
MKLLLSRFMNDATRAYAGIISDGKQLALRHSHDYFEFFVVYRGTAVHRVNGALRPLGKGCAVLMRPEDEHCYSNLSSDFAIINVLVPSQTMQALFDYLGPSFDADRLLSARFPPSVVASPAAFKSLVAELEKLVLSKRLLKSRADAYFRVVLLKLLLTCAPLEPSAAHADVPSWLRWVALEMMKPENFIEGLPAMRRLAGKSEEHVSRACRRFLHRTPTELVNELRLEHAAREILRTDRKIITICAESGFDSLSYFYRRFKQRYGLTPRDLRERPDKLDAEASLLSGSLIDVGIPAATALAATARSAAPPVRGTRALG